MSSVARWAGYAAFVIEGPLRAALRGILAIIGLVIAFILYVILYYTVPWSWYDHAIVDQLRAASLPAGWGDVSKEAARIFPDGMERSAARALLSRNGFSCSSAAPNRLTCSRTLGELACTSDFHIELMLNDDQRVANRNATYHSVCL